MNDFSTKGNDQSNIRSPLPTLIAGYAVCLTPVISVIWPSHCCAKPRPLHYDNRRPRLPFAFPFSRTQENPIDDEFMS